MDGRRNDISVTVYWAYAHLVTCVVMRTYLDC